MEIRNDTPFADGLVIGMGPDRQPCLTVVVKGTFRIPTALDGRVEVADEQLEILTAEEYHDGDVTGSLCFDSDAVPLKPRTDVALVGRAYTPNRQPARVVDVSLRVGSVRKALRVFGNRQWVFPGRAAGAPRISEPALFTDLPLRYEYAYGGFDRKAGASCDRNYVGKGVLGKKTMESVDGTPLPNIEDPHRLIATWDDEPVPAGFGFCNATWQPRARYAGTEQGMAQPHPVFGLAADFRHDYYNGAHPDLQAPGYLEGREEVELIHVTPDGRRRFRLPGVHPRITVHAGTGDDPDAGEATVLDTVLDTLVFVPDDGFFYQVWRGSYPLPDLEADLLAIRAVDVRLA